MMQSDNPRGDGCTGRESSQSRNRRFPLILACVTLAASLCPFSAGIAETAVSKNASPELNLATFDRAWELINERYWDEDFGGLDWVGIGDELRPAAEAAESRQALRKILTDMVGRLGQSHFGIIPARDGSTAQRTGGPECATAFSDRLQEIIYQDHGPGDAGPGFEIRFVGGDAFVTAVDAGSPGEAAGVEIGWSVIKVGDQPVADVLPCVGEDLPERMKGRVIWELVTSMLHGNEGDRVKADFLDRQGAPRTARFELVIPSDAQTVTFGNLPPMQFRFSNGYAEVEGSTFGVIRFNSWMMPAAPLFEAAVVEMSKAQGMVIDLRGNPGGVAGLSAGFAGYFVDSKESIGTLKTRRDELHLRINPRRVTRAGKKFVPYAGPVAILVDQFSASTSEIFAAGMQDLERARIFGETSMAAALPAVIEELPNGDFLMHAMADLLRPNGERVEGEGVVPDESVPLTVDGLRSGKDQPFEAALTWLRSQDFDPSESDK